MANEARDIPVGSAAAEHANIDLHPEVEKAGVKSVSEADNLRVIQEQLAEHGAQTHSAEKHISETGELEHKQFESPTEPNMRNDEFAYMATRKAEFMAKKEEKQAEPKKGGFLSGAISKLNNFLSGNKKKETPDAI